VYFISFYNQTHQVVQQTFYGRFTLYGTTRQKPVCIHVYRQWTYRQNILFFKSNRQSLSVFVLSYRRPARIRAWKNHIRISGHVVSCRVVSCRIMWIDLYWQLVSAYKEPSSGHNKTVGCTPYMLQAGQPRLYITDVNWAIWLFATSPDIRYNIMRQV
jgi:hypothetical protein